MCENCEKLEKALKITCAMLSFGLVCNECPAQEKHCFNNLKSCSETLYNYFTGAQNE